MTLACVYCRIFPIINLEMRYIILLIIFFIVLNSCVSVQFENPQPKGKKRLTEFPEKYIGQYKLLYDTLKINQYSLQYPEEAFNEAIPINKIDSNEGIKIVDNLIYDTKIDSTIGINYEIYNDTLYYNYIKKKEIFLSDTVIVKYFRKLYFLNIGKAEGVWDVFIIKPQDNSSLSIQSTYNATYIEENDTTEVNYEFNSEKRIRELMKEFGYDGVSNSYIIDPKRKELVKLIKRGLFSNFIELEKIK